MRRFSTARIEPDFVCKPTAVEPSLMASMAYSTWKRRPSGEKVLTPLSYSERVKYIVLVEIYFAFVIVGSVCWGFCFEIVLDYCACSPCVNFGFHSW